MNKDLPQRKNTRLLGFDYNSPGAYFITICTQGKRKILSRIIAVGGDVLDAPFGDLPHVELLPHGKIADKYINRLNNFYDDIKVDSYVIMPNHIHIMLIITETGASRTSPPTKQHAKLSRFVSTLKRFCNKEYGQNIWQVSFNDHIIRNHEDYENHLKYIFENPSHWYSDELYTKE
ncbi:MAG: hypothetical protein IJY50_08175 [Clostridia bacterium]|nr:hypothetical protein [Clostridia bacterium]